MSLIVAIIAGTVGNALSHYAAKKLKGSEFSCGWYGATITGAVVYLILTYLK